VRRYNTAAQRTIDIVAKDAYGNIAAGISLSDIDVSIDNLDAPMPAPSPFSFTGSPVFVSNGVYRVTYAATMPGRYTLEVNVGRGIHSLTSQLNLRRFGHTTPCPPV
jgi:hypothetical protein